MAVRVEKHPLEMPAMELRLAIREIRRPFDEAVALLEIIGRLRFTSTDDVEGVARELRALAAELKTQTEKALTMPNSPHSLLRGLRELERNLRAISQKQGRQIE